jgi:hypothetical protein
MSLPFLKPNHSRLLGGASLFIGLALALFLHFSATSQRWTDFASGLLLGIGIALLVVSFSA